MQGLTVEGRTVESGPSGFFECFGHGGVTVDGSGDVFCTAGEFHNADGFRDEFGGVGGEDVSA